MLDIHIVEVGHDQSLQMLDLMSFTEMSVQNVEGTEVDMSVEIVVDGAADKFRGFIDDSLCGHESPVDQNFEQVIDNDMSRNKINRKRQPQPPAATATTAATAKALHTVHSNSFVGFGGSD